MLMAAPRRSVPSGAEIRVRGIVQGVGFRPTVWRLAIACGLTGRVRNDSAGVLIEAEGSDAAIERFLARLAAEAPPLARIDAIERTPLSGPLGAASFEIAASRTGAMTTAVAADAAICSDCRAEILSPFERRYRYPFTNCTHCGPRFSIVERVPYDRAHTTMALIRNVPGVRRRVRRAIGPALPRATDCLSRLRSARLDRPLRWPRNLLRAAQHARRCRRRRQPHRQRRDRRDQGPRRLSSRLRCDARRRRREAESWQAQKQQAVRADGARSRRHRPVLPRQPSRAAAPGRAGGADRRPRGIGLRAAAGCDRAGPRHARLHAALHAPAHPHAASPCPARGDDQRQCLRRAAGDGRRRGSRETREHCGSCSRARSQNRQSCR